MRLFTTPSKLTVGVIVVDPSSTLSGGAILGDRLHMKDEGLFGEK